MSKEVIVRLRDDIDDSIGDDIASYEFGFRGVLYEIDLSPDNFAKMELALAEFVKVAREVKPKRGGKRKRAAPAQIPVAEVRAKIAKPVTARVTWSGEIHAYAASLGYDWDDKAQRSAIRQWGGLGKVGLIPRKVLDAHHAAVTAGEITWPPKGE